MVGKPAVEDAAKESVGEGIPVDSGANEHHRSGKDGGEAHAHLVEDDAGKNQEENKHIEESLRSLHCAESRRVPAACRLQQVLDRR